MILPDVVVASNPADWKFAAGTAAESAAVRGCDAAGFVHAVGDNVKDFKRGDRVAAFTRFGGAYAEYSVAPAHTVFHLGPKTTFEEAATVPAAYTTAAIGLVRDAGLELVEDPNSTELATLAGSAEGKKTSLLVYGASSTVGVFVVQLAKKLGLFVVGVAGASGAAAKSYGADLVLDYRSDSFDANLLAAVKTHDIHSAFDAVTDATSVPRVVTALATNGGGHFSSVFPLQGVELPAGVTNTPTNVGQAHADPAVKPLVNKYFTLAGTWLESGELKGQRVTVVPGGLAGVKEGLRRMQAGEVSGEKLVYRIADTPGLT